MEPAKVATRKSRTTSTTLSVSKPVPGGFPNTMRACMHKAELIDAIADYADLAKVDAGKALEDLELR